MKPKICALVSTPRAGTHYLRMSLDNHPKIRWVGEFFRNCRSVLKSYERIKSYIYNDLCSTIIDQYDHVGFVWHLTLESNLPPSKVDHFILLKRKNILEHLCSLIIATKTRNWRDIRSTEKIELNIPQLKFFIDRQDKLYKDFESWGVKYKTVFYEDLCCNFDDTMDSIQDYLGLEHFCIPPAKLKKQENRKIQEIISNYEEVEWTLADMNLL